MSVLVFDSHSCLNELRKWQVASSRCADCRDGETFSRKHLPSRKYPLYQIFVVVKVLRLTPRSNTKLKSKRKRKQRAGETGQNGRRHTRTDRTKSATLEDGLLEVL